MVYLSVSRIHLWLQINLGIKSSLFSLPLHISSFPILTLFLSVAVHYTITSSSQIENLTFSVQYAEFFIFNYFFHFVTNLYFLCTLYVHRETYALSLHISLEYFFFLTLGFIFLLCLCKWFMHLCFPDWFYYHLWVSIACLLHDRKNMILKMYVESNRYVIFLELINQLSEQSHGAEFLLG